MQIVMLIRAREYPLDEASARWLERVIRSTCVDAAGRAWDREARAAMQVADVIAEDLGRHHSPEPIELGHTSAFGLLTVFQDNGGIGDVQAHVAASEGLARLYLALRRYALEAA